MSVSTKDNARAPIGPVGPAGNTPTRTGSWALAQPEIDSGRCNKCLLCWIFCPEGCILRQVSEGVEQVPVVDYYYCKGCGICERECPLGAIAMVER